MATPRSKKMVKLIEDQLRGCKTSFYWKMQRRMAKEAEESLAAFVNLQYQPGPATVTVAPAYGIDK